MIPVVFEALTDALEKEGLTKEVRFIRCSTEPLAMFLFTPGIAGTIRPVNLIKNIVLHFLSHPIRKELERRQIETGRLFGIAMTGHMDSRRVGLLMDRMRKFAVKKDTRLEIMTHPGRVPVEELRPEYGNDDIGAFTSPDRDLEYDMLMELAGNEKR